jgi:NADH dehydrogenase
MVRVLVVGGGYAGLAAVRAAQRSGASVTLVDATGRHELLPRLAAVAGGTAPAGDAWVPLQEIPSVDVVVATVAHMDIPRRAAVLEDGRRLSYDVAVITVGAVPLLPSLRGLKEHARALKSAAQALELRALVAGADGLVVLGGGATGVQLAAECRRARPDLPVTVVEAADGILPQLDARSARAAARILRRAGVEVRTGGTVVRVLPDGALLADGTRVRGLVVWAGPMLVGAPDLVPGAHVEDGRIAVDAELRVVGVPALLAAGDAAAQRGADGSVLPMTAQVAEQAGRAAGRNAALIAAGSMPRPVTTRHRGWVVPLGRSGVGRLLGVPLVGVLGRMTPLLHLAIDCRHLAKLGGVRLLRRFAPGSHRPSAADLRTVAGGPRRGSGRAA